MSHFFSPPPFVRFDLLYLSCAAGDALPAGPVVALLEDHGVPLWHGFDPDSSEAAPTAAPERIRKCSAFLLFLSRSTFQDPFPHTRYEYKLAQRFGKPIYVILLEELRYGDIPGPLLRWWQDLRGVPCFAAWEPEEMNRLLECLQQILGKLEPAEQRIQQIAQYQQLCYRNEYKEADALLSGFLRGKTPEARAQLLYEMLSRSPNSGGVFAPLFKDLSFRNQYRGDSADGQEFHGHRFRAEARTVFHRGLSDADVLDIFRDGACIFTVPGLVDVWSICIIPSGEEDVLYVSFASSPPDSSEDPASRGSYLSLVVLENACKKFRVHVLINPYCRPGAFRDP